MVKRYLFLIVTLAFVHGSILAQDSTSTKVRDQLEKTFEDLDLDENNNGEQLIYFLQELENNPINLNSAEITDLLQIPGVTYITARLIIEYRVKKPFETIEEVQKISGIGLTTYEKISPYITIGNAKDRFSNLYSDPKYWFNNTGIEIISRYQQTIEEQEGFKRPDSLGGYTGNPVKYYQRFKFQSNHLSFNLTQEKDAGETLAGPTDFDFNSIHLALVDNGRLKKLIIGDYSLSFGQGLVVWSGGAFGKGREVIQSIGRNERGLKPYTSAQESNFFRGIAATIGDTHDLTIFYSNIPQTASVVGSDSVRFPSSSGFHRTTNEINRRDNVHQTTVGGRLRFNSLVGLFGLSAYSTHFDATIIKGNSISNQHDFEGRTNSVIGVDYRALVGRSLVIGELAYSDYDAFAGLIGVESSVGNLTDIAIQYRNYSGQYVSILGDGFGESSGTPQNERGVYIGLKHQVSKFTLSTYVDQYHFDAPKSGIQSPSGGIDVLGMIEATFSRTLSGYLLIRNESKDEAFEIVNDAGRQEERTGTKIRSSYRIQIQHQPTPSFRSRSRVEWIRVNSSQNDLDKGFLIYQDVRLNVSKKLLLDARFTLFDTDSFNARVYQFENDLRYVLSNVALNDRGQRWYVLAKYDISGNLEMSLKISRSVIEDAQILSSGLNEIKGDKRTQFGAQIRYKF